ncbi:hypothetical protein IL252_00835 [Halomicrobium sp. IBSBa]|uniref:hypothetical protein n=1 Tax=Halomicrobium sp. IBSBa TaxID=2778916 RepID=UPI001ABFA331|nr:hypothetical protein [Halomicrobium sp. IBSBa]MBO4246360.1 hypothetical protein [Halomicrobium sp. IBSBa]
MKLRDRIGVSASTQRRLTRLMQLSLIGMLFIGIERGSTGIIVNTGIGLLVAQLPAVLERDYEIPLDAGLTLWITGAVWLHALGTVGLPGAEANFYATIWWWDHLTHVLSSSIVAAAGYTTVRSLDQHSDGIHIPPRFMFVFILLFVLAFGVLWEVIEFAVSTAAASVGSAPVLTQYGLNDTMLDLVFDTIGAVVVAVWGTAYLTDVVGILSETLDTRST